MVGISVIIPVYNVEKYIEECIRSVLKNAFQDFEIICVNDGSKDSSLELLERLSQEDTRVKVYSQENQGQSVARNKGLQVAQGKYVYFLDSDDKITENALGELYQRLERDQLDVLYFSGESFYESAELEEEFSSFKSSYQRKEVYEGVYDGMGLFSRMRENKDYSMSPCIQIIRRGLLDENNIRFIEGIIHEDNHFAFMTIINAKRAGCVQDVYFLRRIRESSVMTTTKNHRNLLGYFVCMCTVLKCFDEIEISEEYETVVSGLIKGMKSNVKKHYLEISEEEREEFFSLISQQQRLFFKSLILSEIETEVKLRKSVKKQKKETEKIKKSKAYKIGRLLTAPMRKAKRLLKMLMKKPTADEVAEVADENIDTDGKVVD